MRATFAAVIVMMLSGCVSGAPGYSADHPAKGRFEIVLDDFAFHPNEAWVYGGKSTLVFVNHDNVNHTVTFRETNIDSGVLRPGQRFETANATDGDLMFYCRLHVHVGMEGVIHAFGMRA